VTNALAYFTKVQFTAAKRFTVMALLAVAVNNGFVLGSGKHFFPQKFLTYSKPFDRSRIYYTRGLYYNTFYGRNLRIFVIS
jgi:hypothetical protein